MKVKILEPFDWYKHFVGSEFEVDKYDKSPTNLRFRVEDTGWIYNDHCVITELPESFCVKRCDDGIKWGKYIDWLNKKCGNILNGFSCKYYGVHKTTVCGKDGGYFGTEIHIDDMIKHIDYMERHIKGGEEFHKESQLTVKMDKEFDLTTNEGRLAYARKHYPIGTKYIPLSDSGQAYDGIEISEYKPRIWVNDRNCTNGIEVGRVGLIYHEKSNKWAEIIKEEVNMETQKLSRIGLEEIHSVACTSWKKTLVDWAKNRNIFKEYIELSQEEVNNMFDACTKDQLPIVSKYLKQYEYDLLDFDKVRGTIQTPDGQQFIGKRVFGKFENKSFYLHNAYDWEIKEDDLGELCLIPTKKKFSAEKGWVL